MKKLTIKFALIFATLCILILAGCSDILLPEGQIEEAKQGLLITVTSEDQTSRTLYPSADFTKYVLSFENTDGSATYAEKTITGTTQAFISDLPNGVWKITAKGYVIINSKEYEAAQGSNTITISSGSLQNLGIEIKASQTGTDGYFSYSVSFPSTVGIDSARLYLQNYGSSSSYYSSFDLLSMKNATFSLSPGYYLMNIALDNNLQTVWRTEIVHIYANMETKADYSFSVADFNDLITLSGTVSAKINGTPLQEFAIRVYDDDNYSNQIAYKWFYEAETTWSIKIPLFDTPKALYFGISYNLELVKIEQSVTVSNQDKTGINLTANFSTIALGDKAIM